LAENTKYDILINELSSIESMVSILIHKYKDTYDRNTELENKLAEANRENEVLLQQIARMEEGIQNNKETNTADLFNSLTSKERDSLKIKLQSLISKIDYHISS